MSSRHSKMCSKIPQNREQGIALISVLWVLLLLSGLASAAAFMARTNAILTHKLGEYAQAESTADAAIVSAIGELSDEKTSRHPPIDGQPQSGNLQGIPVIVSISSEAGRIDINTADDGLILAFLRSQGASEETASRLLGDLNARRHANDGANHILRTLGELQQIPSWQTQYRECWTSALTVYSGLPGVNASDPPPVVLQTLRWAEDHHFLNREWITASASTTPSVGGRSVLGEVLRIRVTAAVSRDLIASREWVGRLTGDREKPTLTMRWESGAPSANCESSPQVN
jgi:general secretion pathway protein K